MTKLKNIFYISVASLFLTACGGGGGGDSSPPTPPPPPANVAPVSDAGAAQTVDEGDTVDLSGSGTDSDGTISSFAWTQASGEAVTLSNADMQNASFTAPNTGSASSISLVFTLTVTDDDGATGSSNVSITVNTTNQTPTADAGADQSVDEQSVVTLDGSASTDADGSIASYDWMQLTGAGVSIADSSSATTTFDAPSLGASEDLTFRLTVTDDRGVSSTDEVTITVNNVPGLNSAPLGNAGPAQTVASGDTVTLDGSLSTDDDGTIDSYAWAQLSGTPTVTLTNPNTANPSFVAPTVTADTVLSFIVTVTDNEGATADDSVDITITPPPSGITISGKATYSNVPHTAGDALNYSAITQDPIRRAVVELLQNGAIVQSSTTDDNGDYSFDVDANSGTYSVQVKSQALQTSPATWDVRIVDNTNSQAIYSIIGSDFTAGTDDISRPTMNATTAFDGSRYTNISGAPFHVLDRVMDGMLKIEAIDPSVVFPLVNINWSVNNSATGGNLTTGAITTSFFTSNAGAGFTGPQIFLLGAEDSDTDEYDGHVIIHEWGHYFEGTLARSDSIGGSHSGNQRLDMRLAFGEGFGNAWSGIMTDDSLYRDSFGANQTQGFSINVESGAGSTRGWYNEQSTASIIYDIYDSNSDGTDAVSLGLEPIYDVLVGQQRNTEAFTSIFSFVTYLKDENPAQTAAIDALLTTESISGTDIWGAGETNNAGRATDVLPVFTDLTVGGPAVNICSLNAFDPTNDGNKLSVFRYMRVDIPTAGNYRVTVSAAAGQDPDIQIFRQGTRVAVSEANGAEDSVISLTQSGTHSIAVYNFNNFDANANAANECYDVQIQNAP